MLDNKGINVKTNTKLSNLVAYSKEKHQDKLFYLILDDFQQIPNTKDFESFWDDFKSLKELCKDSKNNSHFKLLIPSSYELTNVGPVTSNLSLKDTESKYLS
jgi:hypothetical protein